MTTVDVGARWLRVSAATGGEPGRAGCVKGTSQGVVEGPHANLVAHAQSATGSNHVSASSAFLLGDDRCQGTVDRRVQALHHRMMLVQATAIDAHHDLRTL
jgi:hypothetical protein